jgi:NAD(P)-dependent dehydrogenase (short-subunit alcohol dehydrogenase family)
MVDANASVFKLAVEKQTEATALYPFCGNTTDDAFRKAVFDEMCTVGLPTICVPAAGITRDGLAVKLNKETRKADVYPVESFKLVVDVNLIAPTYWAMEMTSHIAEARGRWNPSEGDVRGTVIFIGSTVSQGNSGQVAYTATKKGLTAVALTLTQEAMFYGVRCGVVHPGFTDTPMVQQLPAAVIEKSLKQTQIKRLLQPQEVAEAICFMISNSAVCREMWVDGGWHPAP